jgi:hypothetical protein
VEGKHKGEVEIKRQSILDSWLTPVTGDGTADEAPRKGQFADPAARMKE